MVPLIRVVRNQRLLIAAGVALLALIVRMPSGDALSWWIDELITWQVARLPFLNSEALSDTRPPFTSMVGFALNDRGPGPLTYLLDGMAAQWASAMGGEGILRVPSIVAAAMAAGLVAWGAFAIGGVWGAVAGGCYLAVSPAVVEYTTIPRGYAWALLASALQLVLMQRIVRQGCESTLRRDAVLFAAVTTAGFFVHPFQALWSASLVVAGIWSSGRGHGWALVRLFAAMLAVPVLIGAAWLVAWHGRLSAQATGISAGLDPIRNFLGLAEALTRAGTLPVLVVCLLVLGLGGARFHGRRRMALRTVLVALFFGAVLAGLLIVFFRPSARHLFVLDLAAAVALGAAAPRIAHGWHFRQVRRLAVAGGASVIFVAAAISMYGAARPRNDWQGVIEYLHPNLKDSDIVLTGPNAEIELLWVYLEAAGLKKERAPAKLLDGKGAEFDAGSEAGVAFAVSSGHRVWYVTGFPDYGKTPEYWKKVHASFEIVHEVPGWSPIFIGLRAP